MTDAKQIVNTLNQSIVDLCQNPSDFIVNPAKDFTRNRKISFENVIRSLITMEDKALSHEIVSYFMPYGYIPSESAFVQQRAKIKHTAWAQIFRSFTSKANINYKSYRGYRLLAVDGSDIRLFPNPQAPDSHFPHHMGGKSYNLVHLNALYDLKNHIFLDAQIQESRKENEHQAFIDMTDNLTMPISKAIVTADRNYESYNNMAHIAMKGWNFLFRIRNSGNSSILSAFPHPEGEFDIEYDVVLTYNTGKSIRELAKNEGKICKVLGSGCKFDFISAEEKRFKTFPLKLRLVSFQLDSGEYEVIATNLSKCDFPASEIMRLYAMRWGIETAFRDLKYGIGMVYFHSKKTEFIFQEIFARLILYNFSQMIISQIPIPQKVRKHDYQINFSNAIQFCRFLFLNQISTPSLKSEIPRFLSSIRLNRKSKRDIKQGVFQNFINRIA